MFLFEGSPWTLFESFKEVGFLNFSLLSLVLGYSRLVDLGSFEIVQSIREVLCTIKGKERIG